MISESDLQKLIDEGAEMAIPIGRADSGKWPPKRKKSPWWKRWFSLALPISLALTSCVAPGIHVYRPTVVTDKDGGQHVAKAPVLLITGDMPGLSRVAVDGVTIETDDVSGVISAPVLNKARSAVIGYSTRPVVRGLSASEPIIAAGTSANKIIRAGGSVVGTAFAGAAGISAAAAAGSAATTAAGAVTP